MTRICRACWQNAAMEVDSEILDIDIMEDELAPLESNIVKIRELISSLELCHHKAERWVENIIEAIGTGYTNKGLGTRLSDAHHPVEEVWQNACEALSSWSVGFPNSKGDLLIGTVPASKLFACLGEVSALKQWQVQRVVERINEYVHLWQSSSNLQSKYVMLLLSGGDYEVAYRNDCPEHYEEHEDFCLSTVRTIIHDTVDGKEAELSLAIAIDILMPCH